MGAPIPKNEAARLARLQHYKILDTPPEAAFDRITRIAAEVIGVPMALVSLVDEKRQWFKSRIGLQATQTPREFAFCAHAIMSDEIFEVQDASQHSSFRTNPLVTGDPNIRFYAGAPIVTSDGAGLGTVCVIDRVPRQMSEQQRGLLRDLSALALDELELRLAARTALEEVAERIQADHVKTEFLANVTHELRTPLTSIVGSLGLLAEGTLCELPESLIPIVDIASRNSELLLQLINDLLDSAKLEAGQLECDFRPIDLAALLPESAENLKSYCADKDIRIRIEGCERPVIVHGDKLRLHQVLNNLLSNAIKFSPAAAEVTLSLAKGDRAQVSVADVGGGIPLDLQPRIFQKFTQAKATGKGPPGTGLGLSIAKMIVEAHAGEITFTSTPGKGTIFNFRLPLI